MELGSLEKRSAPTETAFTETKLEKKTIPHKNTAELSKGFSIEALLAKSSPLPNTVWNETYRSKYLYYPVWRHNSCDITRRRSRDLRPSFSHFQHIDNGEYVADKARHTSIVEKRTRTKFSNNQLRSMEEQFSRRQYIVGKQRECFASGLGLHDTQVKVWFQNRRTKWRNQQREMEKKTLVTEVAETKSRSFELKM